MAGGGVVAEDKTAGGGEEYGLVGDCKCDGMASSSASVGEMERESERG